MARLMMLLGSLARSAQSCGCRACGTSARTRRAALLPIGPQELGERAEAHAGTTGTASGLSSLPKRTSQCDLRSSYPLYGQSLIWFETSYRSFF